MSVDHEKLIEIARNCGAFTDALYAGRHSNIVFTPIELEQFARQIEQPHIDTIEDLHDEIGRLRAVLTELDESSDYWSEYDVPLGIVDRIKAALEQTK